MEDKKKICRLLLQTLQETRAGADLLDLQYDPDSEVVTMVFVSGYKRKICVECDSGIAMIRDITRGL